MILSIVTVPVAVPRGCVCVSVRSFLPPRASTRLDLEIIIGTYVFTATRKSLYIQVNATALGRANPAARGIGSANTHQIAYTYCLYISYQVRLCRRRSYTYRILQDYNNM